MKGAALALGVGVLVALGIAEVALRLYNPIELRLRGTRIVLPTNTHSVLWLDNARQLASPIRMSRNSLGFRGPEPPVPFADAVSILAVGGSTTECRLLSDEETWPAVLERRLAPHVPRLWLDNAGLDGHSTYGHLELLQQVIAPLGPRYALFLVGANDVGRDDLNDFDQRMLLERRSLGDRLIAASELLSTVQVLARSLRAAREDRGHKWELDLASAARRRRDVPPDAEATLQRERQVGALPAYARRLEALVLASRAAGIEPVLITQPALWGEGSDPATGIALDTIASGRWNAGVRWRLLELYNSATRRVGAAHDVLVIDLATAMPKDSRLFYDWVHYTAAGARRVAEIVERDLLPFLGRRGDAPATAPGATPGPGRTGHAG
jgi:lysophospholipase L1-like esterase